MGHRTPCRWFVLYHLHGISALRSVVPLCFFLRPFSTVAQDFHISHRPHCMRTNVFVCCHRTVFLCLPMCSRRTRSLAASGPIRQKKLLSFRALSSQTGVSVDDALAVAYAASVDRCFQQLLVRAVLSSITFPGSRSPALGCIPSLAAPMTRWSLHSGLIHCVLGVVTEYWYALFYFLFGLPVRGGI